MPERRAPKQPAKTEKRDGSRKVGGGWQKPVKPPSTEGRPPGLPPKKDKK
jgi:hypothetical protein